GRERRFAERGYSGIFLYAVVPRQGRLVRRLSENLQFVAVGTGGEITAQPRPGISAVRRLEQIISAVINRRVVERGNSHGRIPLITVMGVAILRFRCDGALLL